VSIERVRELPLDVLVALRAELGPTFASREQERFFDSTAREVLYSGWMGAGKSRILCEKGWAIASQYPGCTVGIFRKVAASLPATTLRTFQRDVMDLRHIRKRNLTESWWELHNGSRIYFMGLDPDPVTGVPSKIGSLELAWAGVDEAVELAENDWMMLLGRLRDPRIPYHQIAAATNPGPPKHWLLQRFLSADPERLMLYAKGNRFLPSDYKAILDSLPDNAVGRRLGKGEWAAVEGAIWKVQDWQVRDVEGKPLYCESDVFAPGEDIKGYSLLLHAQPLRCLTAICYDLRFPEVFRDAAGSLRKEKFDVIFVPAAFTHQTGQDHWEVLLRARAIENQAWVVACNQTGFHSEGRKRNYGNSMIVDPWGRVVARLGEEVGVLMADVDLDMVHDARVRLPALADRVF
jgi:hypothetical protein